MIILYYVGFVAAVTLIKCFITDINAIKRANAPPDVFISDYDENSDISEINRLERIENYDKQIDGYTQLIKLLDMECRTETDNKKRAAILSKQLATMEKLNKTIEKREKLDI